MAQRRARQTAHPRESALDRPRVEEPDHLTRVPRVESRGAIREAHGVRVQEGGQNVDQQDARDGAARVGVSREGGAPALHRRNARAEALDQRGHVPAVSDVARARDDLRAPAQRAASDGDAHEEPCCGGGDADVGGERQGGEAHAPLCDQGGGAVDEEDDLARIHTLEGERGDDKALPERDSASDQALDPPGPARGDQHVERSCCGGAARPRRVGEGAGPLDAADDLRRAVPLGGQHRGAETDVERAAEGGGAVVAADDCSRAQPLGREHRGEEARVEGG
mmetsp:Transcript_55571/g.132450  ORF Transcript_55571/g.132450 Transcript_55571/m.132450 type:complete len:280 (-) Transcript_55571:2002-2841(-)